MPFPLTFDGRQYDHPPDFAAAVFDSAGRQQFPERVLAQLHRAGGLSRDESVGLCAALVQSGEPAAVACGARFARLLGESSLSRLLVIALEALDMGTLLASINEEGTSVEDLLLVASAELLGTDDDLRHVLLTRLRNASLGGSEARVLCVRGTADEIARGLPNVLLEGLPRGAAASVASGLARPDDDVAQAILNAVSVLDRGERMAILAAATRLGVHRQRTELESVLG